MAVTGAETEPETDTESEQGRVLLNGQPLSELPADLFIPPDALEVILEAFEGPLDLLLWLIRRHKLDIVDLPIVEITRQYIEYVELMQELKLELAAEYLVMAATLAEIKSRSLLPRPVLSDDEEDEEDPRQALIRRLQEYEQFKTAAEKLDEIPRQDRDFYTAQVDPHPEALNTRPIMPDVSLEELVLAMAGVMRRTAANAHHQIEREVLSTRERMSRILELLADGVFVEFVQLFQTSEGRPGVVVTFLAILELSKEGIIEITQSQPLHPIYVRSKLHAEPEPDTGSETGEDQDNSEETGPLTAYGDRDVTE